MEKFVRKSDGTDIDDEEVFVALLNSKEELWLIALESGEDYGM